MQTFTYKKRGFENLNIYVDRINDQDLFFMSDIQSLTMQHWVLMGFDWTIGYRTYEQMIGLARLLKSILCIFENGKQIICFDFEEDLRITYSQEINVKDPMNDEREWNEGIGGVMDGPEDVVIDEEVSLRFTPAVGFVFVGWYDKNGNLLSNNNEYNFIVEEGMEIVARSQKKWYTVTATKGDYIESVEVGPSLPPTQEGNGTMRIAHGEGVILSCTLLPDTTDYTYDFDGWYDNNVKVPNEGTTAAIDPVTKNINWTAKGKRTVTPNYSLTAKAVFKAIGSDTYVESTEGGTVTPTSGSYKNGVKVTLTSEVAADTETAGYLFDGYFTGMNDGNNLSYSKTYGITISGNTTVYARFSASEKSGS